MYLFHHEQALPPSIGLISLVWNKSDNQYNLAESI